MSRVEAKSRVTVSETIQDTLGPVIENLGGSESSVDYLQGLVAERGEIRVLGENLVTINIPHRGIPEITTRIALHGDLKMVSVKIIAKTRDGDVELGSLSLSNVEKTRTGDYGLISFYSSPDKKGRRHSLRIGESGSVLGE